MKHHALALRADRQAGHPRGRALWRRAAPPDDDGLQSLWFTDAAGAAAAKASASAAAAKVMPAAAVETASSATIAAERSLATSGDVDRLLRSARAMRVRHLRVLLRRALHGRG